MGGLDNFLNVIKEHSEKVGHPMPHFLHWSTCGVYGQPNYEKNKNGYLIPSDENAPYNPPNNYSTSKMEQEKLLINAKKYPVEGD